MSSFVNRTPFPGFVQHAFLKEFQKDLEFFKLFFLLVNKSGISRHMGVMWAADGPAAELGLSHGAGASPAYCGTEHAMQTPSSRCVSCDPHLDPEFCNIINDNGRHAAETCDPSDRAAEKRCRETGKTHIHTCHAGLTDVAVPVISHGQYIGTLLCGQVLRESPSAAGFDRVRQRAAKLDYIDIKTLEAAYWRVPVASDEDIQKIVQLLEMFSEYLSTSWGRLLELVQEQQHSLREVQLLRKEFAHLVLDGTALDRASLRELLRKLGLREAPNRVMVVKLETEEPQRLESAGETVSFDVRFTAALQGIEEVCEAQDSAVATYLRKRGISVFFCDQGRDAPGAMTRQAHGLAQRILEAVKARCDLRVRIGIGGIKGEVAALVQSYDEATMALAQSPNVITAYRKALDAGEDLAEAAERVCACLSARKLAEARSAVENVRMLAERRFGEGPAGLGAQRQALCSTLYSICFCARQLGADRQALDQVLWKIDRDIHSAGTLVELHEVYQRCAEAILDEVRKLYSSKRDRLVERASEMIDHLLEQSDASSRISSSHVARALQVSVSHLGRTFKQVTGMTFERFVMQRRVELAKQLLLNPAYNVSQVAEKCGFSDPGYFARVFHQVAGCSPRQYMHNPLVFSGIENHQAIAQALGSGRSSEAPGPSSPGAVV